MIKLDKFTQAYIECALWSSSDTDPGTGKMVDLDSEYSIDDIPDHDLQLMIDDCLQFQNENYETMLELPEPANPEYNSIEYCGHDFWLSRNGHGTGFFDRGYEDLGNKLQSAAESFGEVNLLIADNGELFYV